MKAKCGAVLGLASFSAVALSGCVRGTEAADVLEKGLLSIPFFYALGWFLGLSLERMRVSGTRTDRPVER